MHLQILATIIILLALFVSQQQLSELKSSEERNANIIQLEEVILLKKAWDLDSLILDEIGNDYRKDTIKNASELAIIMTVMLAAVSEGKEENKQLQDTFELMGDLSRKLNHYRQALIALEKAAEQGTIFDDLNIKLLDHYHSYLLVENNGNGFNKGWTKLCKLAAGFNVLRKQSIKAGGLPEDSTIAKLLNSKRILVLLDWAEKQLVKQSDQPGDFKSTLENINTDINTLVADFVFQMTQPENELREFRTLRQESVKLTYGSEDQLKANSNTVILYKQQLSEAGYVNLRQLQADSNQNKRQIRIIQEDEKIPLPFINTSIPISLISWILPLTNLILFGLIVQSRHNAMNLANKLDQENLDIFKTIQPQLLNYTKITSNDWLWNLHRDTLGCFGLSMITLYYLTLTLDWNKYSLITTYIAIYLLFFSLNIYLWKNLFKQQLHV